MEDQLGFDFIDAADYSYDELKYIVQAALEDSGCTLLYMECEDISETHGYNYLTGDERVVMCTATFEYLDDYDRDVISESIINELSWAGCEVLGDVMFGEDCYR